MLVYLFNISLFLFLFYYAGKKNNLLLYIVAVLFPTLFEGLRAESVGTDLQVYGTTWFYSMDIKAPINAIIRNASTPEYAYFLLMYFCKIISNDIHLFLSVAALIKIFCVYYTAHFFRERMNSLLFVATYYFFFYVSGFSLMRQSLAISICLLSSTFLFNNQWRKFLLAVFVSYEFHNSALLMLVVLALWVVRTQKFNYLITIAMATTVYLSISLILPLLIYSPLFKEGFAEHYINTGVETAKSNISIAMCTLLYGIMLLFSKYKVEKVQNYMLIVCSIYTLVFLFLADYFEVAFRASYYFFIIVLLLVPMSIKREKNENIKNLLQLGYLILYIISFYVAYTHGLSGAAEYESIAIL